MKATKTELKRIIDWSSSRYCDTKKDEVVAGVLKLLKAKSGAVSYTTGSYSERGHLGGWKWHVDGKSLTLTRTPGFKGERESIFVFDS